MNINNRYFRLLVSLVVTLVVSMVLVGVTSMFGEGAFRRILVMFGGTMPEGLIQALTLFFFVFGMLEVMWIKGKIVRENDAFTLGLLPEQDNWVLSPEDVSKLKHNMIDQERREKFMLVGLIKKSCVKYRLSKSSSEVLQLVESQVAIYQMESESRQAMTRYIAWAIPSVGFIGTVIGIAGSLGIADQATSPEGIKAVTDMLAVAFDTTLVSLIYSLVIMYQIHSVQEKENAYFSKLNNYLVDNLINRFYKE